VVQLFNFTEWKLRPTQGDCHGHLLAEVKLELRSLEAKSIAFPLVKHRGFWNVQVISFTVLETVTILACHLLFLKLSCASVFNFSS
jgi:hypothetical protein